MADVTCPLAVKRRPWQLHIDYLQILAATIAVKVQMPSVVAGDFNRRIPRVPYGNRRAADALEAAFERFDIVTRGTPEGSPRPGIDHIALSRHLRADRVWGWPFGVNGRRLSDHDGSGADVGLARTIPANQPDPGVGIGETQPMSIRLPAAGAPEPPYYAVVFASTRPRGTEDGYDEMADAMFDLASSQPGFIGAESVRDANGEGITVSYWTDEDAIAAWHQRAEHQVAQEAGYDRFYERFTIRVAKVERHYGFDRYGAAG